MFFASRANSILGLEGPNKFLYSSFLTSGTKHSEAAEHVHFNARQTLKFLSV